MLPWIAVIRKQQVISPAEQSLPKSQDCQPVGGKTAGQRAVVAGLPGPLPDQPTAVRPPDKGQLFVCLGSDALKQQIPGDRQTDNRYQHRQRIRDGRDRGIRHQHRMQQMPVKGHFF